jgi:hypothetical protein
VFRDYFTPIASTIDRARAFERVIAALDPADQLRDTIPAIQHVIEVAGAAPGVSP